MQFRSVAETQQDISGAPERYPDVTRAPLTQGFMVSCWKAYGYGNQHIVMEDYNVEYKTSGTAWDGTQRPYWDYTTVPGQYQRFWDYSNFPYRFHAITPYPADPNSITLGDVSLSIPASYSMQTVLNGMVTPSDRSAEPYMVAQVQRGLSGEDTDLLATDETKRTINSSSTTRNRYVALPFHHLNSKIRFGIYTTSLWATDNPLYINNLSIHVSSPNFVTTATGYEATLSNKSLPGSIQDNLSESYTWYRRSGNSGFTGLEYDNSNIELLHFDGGVEITDNDLSLHQGRASAYWLQCPEGIMQIPQRGVSMTVSFNLYRRDDGSLYKTFSNVPIRLEGTNETHYDWISGYMHTYYLIINGIEEQLEITFTATLTPWEDISGSLSTDLEQ